MTAEPIEKGRRLPPWFKVRAPGGENYVRLRNLLRDSDLHTVCEEARCPNIGECWERGAATFMILGDICTRACRYCAVTSGKPLAVDLEEPDRLARTVERLGLKYVVITSVNRDDLPDGGAFIFAQCVIKIRERMSDAADGIKGGNADSRFPGQRLEDHGARPPRRAEPQHRDGEARLPTACVPRATTTTPWNCWSR